MTTVFNAEKYVRESLDSIFEQPIAEDFEVILVDDGSTDSSKSILIQYADKYPNITLLFNSQNFGIPISRNRAILLAKGELIAIHDADDISLPNRFNKELEVLKNTNDVDIVGSHALKISVTGEIIGSMVYPPKNTLQAFSMITRFKLNPIIDPTCMFRKNVFIDIGGYTMDPKLRTALDLDLWCRLLIDGHKLINIQAPLIKYRINPNGVTRTENKEMTDATDLIWGSFRRRKFKKISLSEELFRQDCFSQYQYQKQGVNNARAT